MILPGAAKTYRIVTKECRKRDLNDWKDEVLTSVEDALDDLNQCWPKDSDVKFHIVVAVERPK